MSGAHSFFHSTYITNILLHHYNVTSAGYTTVNRIHITLALMELSEAERQYTNKQTST